MKTLYIWSFFACLMLLVGCDDDEGVQSSGRLIMEFSGISEPGFGHIYAIWVKENGVYNYLDEFTINSSGNSTNSIISMDRARLDAIEGILISLETENNIDTSPSVHRVIAGDFINKGAILTIDHPDALGIDFSTYQASYSLSTPTDTVSDNDEFGIWFYDIPNQQPTLNLPDLGEHWTYESWVLLADLTISLGKFDNPTSADLSSEYGGPNLGNSYPAPGGDLLTGVDTIFPASIFDQPIRISVEPVPDDDIEVFGIVPFFDNAIDTVITSPTELEFIDQGLVKGLATKN